MKRSTSSTTRDPPTSFAGDAQRFHHGHIQQMRVAPKSNKQLTQKGHAQWLGGLAPPELCRVGSPGASRLVDEPTRILHPTDGSTLNSLRQITKQGSSQLENRAPPIDCDGAFLFE
jgi:hypothetical protein